MDKKNKIKDETYNVDAPVEIKDETYANSLALKIAEIELLKSKRDSLAEDKKNEYLELQNKIDIGKTTLKNIIDCNPESKCEYFENFLERFKETKDGKTIMKLYKNL